jgi:hypothetical protein
MNDYHLSDGARCDTAMGAAISTDHAYYRAGAISYHNSNCHNGNNW